MQDNGSKLRLQKILARGGVASRRAAEQLITGGHVRVNGKVVTELGAKADPRRDRIEVDGERVVAESLAYVVLHKPRGYVSTMSDPEGRPTVAELVKGVGARVVPVGRLDFATSGVLLMSNDGAFSDGLLHPRKDVPKTYVVKVIGEMTEDDLARWTKGVRLEDGPTKPARARLIRHESGKTWFEITITEGRNQQIRRMGEATGFRVMRLARVAFAGIDHEGLKPGEWRALTADELSEMKKTYGVPARVPKHAPVAPQQRPHAPRAQHGVRHGGGAPARKPMESARDWGSGAGRGASRGRSDRDEGVRDRDDRRAPPGRGGQSRTTGTAGGPGARAGDDYRSTRRPSRRRSSR